MSHDVSLKDDHVGLLNTISHYGQSRHHHYLLALLRTYNLLFSTSGLLSNDKMNRIA